MPGPESGGGFRPRVVQEEGYTPPNFEQKLNEVPPLSAEKFEKMEYAAGFKLLSDQLEEIERLAPAQSEDKVMQRNARKAFEQVWKAFLKDVRNGKKRSERIGRSLPREGTTRVPEDTPAPSSDELSYRAALRLQHRDTVEAFPNEASREAYLDHLWDSSSLLSMHDPVIEDIHYVGALYNDALPLLMKHMNAESLLKGYIPVMSYTVQANITNHLEKMPEMARVMGELSYAQQNVNDRESLRRSKKS